MIDPILLQNREIIEKAYEHINIMTNSNLSLYANTNKFIITSLLILSLSFIYMNKNKIKLLIENMNHNLDSEKKNKNIFKQQETFEKKEEILDNEEEEELSDFEY